MKPHIFCGQTSVLKIARSIALPQNRPDNMNKKVATNKILWYNINIHKTAKPLAFCLAAGLALVRERGYAIFQMRRLIYA
jgi:hypothetical protein